MEFALPTINVIFLLMLYFLSAGTLAEQAELSVVPPNTMDTSTEHLPRPLLVVANDGQFILDGIALDVAALEDAAKMATETATASELNVLVPRDMAAAPFLGLLTRLYGAGIPVRLVTVELPPAAGPS